MALSAAFALHATSLALLLVLLGATANGDVRTATAVNDATVTPGDDTERYICYLCAGRNPMLMRYCPVYWDDCHVVCDYSPAVTSRAEPAALPSSVLADPSAAYGDECYVMKLYSNGSYAIVDRLDCSGVARCFLTCGGGDLNSKALGAVTPVPAAGTTALRGLLPADFERCGTQVADQADPTTVPGGVRRRP